MWLPAGMKPRWDGEGISCQDASGIEDMECCQSERILSLGALLIGWVAHEQTANKTGQGRGTKRKQQPLQ